MQAKQAKRTASGNPDWPMIQLLYMQGLTPATISKQTGVQADTISCRASRCKWRETALQAKQHLVSQTIETLPVQVAKSLVGESKKLRESVSDELQDQVSVLRSKPAKSLSEVQGGKGRKGRCDTLKTLVDAADKVYGWSSESGGNVKLVQVNILAQVSTAAMDKE